MLGMTVVFPVFLHSAVLPAAILKYDSSYLCYKIYLTCFNFIAGTNWFLTLLDRSGQKWRETLDISSIIWAFRTWFLRCR
jgi:hypothetical protein